MNQPQPLSGDERAACAVCADALATGRLWSQAALLALVAVLLAAAAGMPPSRAPGVLIAGLVLGLVERGLALRVQLDARLFDRLARAELATLSNLDHALQQVLAVSAAKAGRALPARIAGALRLYRLQVLATLSLCALDIVAWWRT